MKTYKLVLISVSALGLSGILGGTLAVDSVRSGVVETVKGTVSDTKDMFGISKSKTITKVTPSVDVVEAAVPDEQVEEDKPKKSPPKKKPPMHAKMSIVVPNTKGNTYIIKSSGENAVIDGAYNEDTSILKNSLSKNGVYHSKYAISTTDKSSSIAGMLKNITYTSPDYILTYRTAYKYTNSKNLRTSLGRQGLLWSIIKKPITYNVGYSTLTLLPLNAKGELGVQVEYKNKIFFFAGDITTVESSYLKSLPTKVDAYFISQSSKEYKTSQSLIKRLNPENVIINTQSEFDAKKITKVLKGKANKLITLHGSKEVLIRTDGKRVEYEKIGK